MSTTWAASSCPRRSTVSLRCPGTPRRSGRSKAMSPAGCRTFARWARSWAKRRRQADSGHAKRRGHGDSASARVRQFVGALHDRDFAHMGELLKEAHASLRDDFEVSTPTVDSLVERACSADGCYGARIMGAGFGGSILALVTRPKSESFQRVMGRPVVCCATADG